MSLVRSVILGCGAYLPKTIMTNDDLARIVDTSDEWIMERTGIRQRHIAAEGEMTSDIGYAAAVQALERAQMEAADIDLILVATSTPDQTFPATAVTIQADLGISHGAAFDLQAVCSGFVFALATADSMLRTGLFKRALVIGAETYSRILDWEDRGTCVLFGDGGGALVLEAQKLNGESSDRGILGCKLRSDGQHRDKLYVDGGPSSTRTVGHLRMHGAEVFRHAVTNISTVIEDTLNGSGFTTDDVDWFIPHQANKRILDGTARKIGLPSEKVIVTIDSHANTSAASIPLAMNTAFEDGRLKEGDLLLMEAMGGGFTWGAVLARW